MFPSFQIPAYVCYAISNMRLSYPILHESVKATLKFHYGSDPPHPKVPDDFKVDNLEYVWDAMELPRHDASSVQGDYKLEFLSGLQ